ncbi:hypothetical protein AMAG_03259 [Allomyces macrogynus ATCC 38327]|uniref:RING-type domain-containing protein n=1 Tax=Allomyces macrogynus (strain ATCC 38327) TaxID=578462 RepID=A0A0L0S4X4_ALLM3|nr:hypothetical protein AMAG_03259 [Allomyces macrogynus ATCC 38327]|eukprot:KNE57562.1 hypothetical protein AMAG_03259 [Allomyces macrogynus ATCC 38327]
MALRAVSGTPLPPGSECILPSPPPAPPAPSARSASVALARLSASSISSSTPARRSSTAFIPWQPLTASSAASALVNPNPTPRPLGSPEATDSATVLLPGPAQLVTDSPPTSMATSAASPAMLRRSTRQRAPPPPPPAATPKPTPVSRRPSVRAAPAPAPAAVPAIQTRGAKRSAAAATAGPDAKRRVRVIRRAPPTATVAAPAPATRPAAPPPAPRSRGARARGTPPALVPVVQDDDDDDGMDLDVQDDAPQYGAPQYSERDVMRYAHAVRRDESDQALREMVANAASRVHGTPMPGSRPVSAPVSPSGSANATSSVPMATVEQQQQQQQQQRAVRIRFTVGDEPAPALEPTPVPAPSRPTKAGKTSCKRTASPSADSNLVVEALKARVAELEAQTAEMPRCRICWGVPNTPVVSAVCWHVHCEACWLTALGAKKVCPQCRVIMRPEDLRRVYI